MDLSAAIREARQRAGLSQQALADRAGIHRVSLARYESGRIPDLAEMQKICLALPDEGLRAALSDYLFGTSGTSKKSRKKRV